MVLSTAERLPRIFHVKIADNQQRAEIRTDKLYEEYATRISRIRLVRSRSQDLDLRRRTRSDPLGVQTLHLLPAGREVAEPAWKSESYVTHRKTKQRRIHSRIFPRKNMLHLAIRLFYTNRACFRNTTMPTFTTIAGLHDSKGTR